MTDAAPPPPDAPLPPEPPPPAPPGPHAVVVLDRGGHGLVVLPDQRRVRVPGVDVGEQVHLGPLVAIRGRLWARAHAVERPSPHRVDPACDQAAACPGCPLRHLSPARQADLRVDSHRRTLARLGGVPDGVPCDLLPGAPRDGYRARAVARPFRDGSGVLRLGLRELPAHDAPGIDLARCPAQTPGARALLAALAHDLHALGVDPFDPDHAPHGLRHAVVQADGTGGGLVVLGFGAPPDRAALTAQVLAAHPAVGLHVEVIAPHKHGVLVRPEPLRGPDHLTQALDGEPFRGTLPAWLPQTPITVGPLRTVVVDWLAPLPGEHVVEVGCGVGPLSLALARVGAQVTGIDLIRAAIDDAQHNAAQAGLTDHTHFRVGRAEKALRRLLADGQRADLVVLHGMRKPYGPGVLSGVRALTPRRVLLIGPSAAAVARDVAAAGPGWRAARIGLLDQLPGTAWLLTLVLLVPVDPPPAPSTHA